MNLSAERPSGRLLILDGIGGVPLGRELADAFRSNGVDVEHRDCASLKRIALYGLRSAVAKAVRRGGEEAAYYHLPRSDVAHVEELLHAYRPDCVLVIGFAYKFIDPAQLERLKHKLGFSLFLYDTDSCNLYTRRREFIFFLESELPAYDRIFSFSRVTTDFFRSVRGLDAVHQPFGAAPISTPRADTPEHEVLFVGSCDLRRIFLLEHIRERVSVFGNRWQRHMPLISPALRARITDRPVWGKALHELFGASKIILNITRGPFFSVETGINLRIFEALAAGRLLLTDDCDEVAELLRPGEEMETYRSAAELAEKTAYYLAHDEAREAIALRGHQRFLADYSWQRRAAGMLCQMGMRPAAETCNGLAYAPGAGR